MPGTPESNSGVHIARSANHSNRRHRLAGVGLTLPALLALGLTMVYPLLWTIWLSLNGPNTALRGAPDFKGLGNYARIASSGEFQQALWQTAGLVAMSFVLEAVIGLAVALALHRGLRGAILPLPAGPADYRAGRRDEGQRRV